MAGFRLVARNIPPRKHAFVSCQLLDDSESRENQHIICIRGFSQHTNACERKQLSVEAAKQWKIKKRMEWLTVRIGTLEVDNVNIDDSSESGPESSSQVQDLLISTGIDTQEAQFNTTVDVRNNSMGISVELEDSDPSSSDLESVFDSEEPARRPSISSTYIEIVHHPHSGLEPEYRFRDLGSPTKAPLSTPPQLAHGERPWAPFKTLSNGCKNNQETYSRNQT
ncbi:hypothetical protein K439DRAFT_1622892 [Ramaria rubella]|nr:hypothetical protein K439DRAFT_1622892 [Ramaria rubella]